MKSAREILAEIIRVIKNHANLAETSKDASVIMMCGNTIFALQMLEQFILGACEHEWCAFEGARSAFCSKCGATK